MSNFLHGVEVLELNSGTRPIQTVKSSVIGLIGTAPSADAAKFPLNTPVLIAGRRTEAAALGADGSLPAAVDGIFDQIGAAVVVVRVEKGADDDATMTNMVGGVNSSTGAYEGVHAFLGAESVLGVAPRILIAPEYSHQRAVVTADPLTYGANPVVAEMVGIAKRLRAVIIADGPNTNDADAITYRGDHGADGNRVFIVDPKVKVFKNDAVVEEAASARVAGMIARSDHERGFWWSPSNTAMNGIVGTARPVDFQLGDSNSRANNLNENEVATIIRHEGFRLWGNRTASSDSKWAFLSVVRTADMINDSLLRAHLWAVDRNITKTYIEDVTNSVQAYLDGLKAQGAILGGSIWADDEANTPESIAAGKIYFNFDFTPPTPAEHIVFRSILTNDYIEEIL